jgi:hypothetical protein
VKEYDYDELYSFFIKILPKENFNICFVEDILSTRVRLKTKKYFKNGFIGRVLGGGLGRLIKFCEKNKLVSYNQNNIVIKENFTQLTGSYYIEIFKTK